MSRVVVIVMAVVMAVQLSQATKENSLIVILVDGFRWDYTVVHGAGTQLPGFQHFQTAGTRAEYLRPVYPSLSYPNWHTIATGLYPERHGIIGNLIYDPERNKTFYLMDTNSTTDPTWWGDAEAIWTTATNHGLQTALFQWSRCDVQWRTESDLPRYCERFEYDPTGSTHRLPKRLSQAVDMIKEEDYRLVMVYEGSVDTRGHYKGPLSPEVAAAVRDVDQALQQLWRRLEETGMVDTTNVVVVSDHGMTQVNDGSLQEVEVGQCLQESEVQVVVNEGSYLTLRPAPDRGEQVVESLNSCPELKHKVKAFLKESVPPRYHYRAHRLIPEVVAIAEKGYTMNVNKLAPSIKVLTTDASSYFGNHGFDDTHGQHPDMRGVLYAAGPAFARSRKAGPVEQVDVYGLLCHTLLLPCHANNGTPAHIAPFFATPPPNTDGWSSKGVSVSIFTTAAAILVFFFFFFCVRLSKLSH
ncbi:glycerophosphocholine cholinephosphodiesterase ENPP6-like [Scylla paramamosain]|uniref:glycerophosphocholine cholinephosphodiesterase ENPP6-like n=1 Tax=Scylla paramamosain TaxID=85552 RepID=UPI0030826ECC